MTTRRLTDLQRDLANRGVDVRRLRADAGARDTLAAAGAQLERLAEADLDGNGWIQGGEEVKAAFRYADGFDRNGDGGSVLATDAAGRRTAAGAVLDFVSARATPVPQAPSTPRGVTSRDEAYGQLLAQARREGSNGNHLAVLDRGLASSPFKADAARATALFARRPDGLTLAPGSVAGAEPFPKRGERVGTVQPLPFLGASTTQASVAVLNDEGGLKARWYGRDQDTNAPFWSAAKSVNALGVIAKLNAAAPSLEVGRLSVREAGRPETAINLGALFQDITSYDAGVPRSNAGAGLLGRLLGTAGREGFVQGSTGHAVQLAGNFGGGTIFNHPEVVGPDGRVVLQAPETAGTPGKNRIAASDLTRLHAQAVLHKRLAPDQRLAGAQAHSLEAWTSAMTEDSARYADVALQTLGLAGAVKDVAISSKLGFGYVPETGKYEAAYSGVLQFTDTRHSPPRQRTMAFTLRGEQADPVALDANLAADMTELVRRLANDEL
jgi:hypothetical protein